VKHTVERGIRVPNLKCKILPNVRPVLKLQSVPHGKHITPPLQGPTGCCCLGKNLVFTLRTIRNTQNVKFCYVKIGGTYSNHFELCN
jgi:hypothetical protein